MPIVYAALGLLLWSEPLLSILHVESAAVVAAAAFFTAGCSSLVLLERGYRPRRLLILHEAALVVPAALLTASALWQPNCDYLRGLLFFAGFPGITVVFAVASARLIHVLPLNRKKSAFVAFGLLIVVVPTLADLGLRPQFYTYNHVFGGVLGPIYDEELAIRPGLFWFRALTLLWSALLILVARWIERRQVRPALRLTVLGCTACMVAAYAFAPELGFVTTYGRIEAELSGMRRTAHFEIYYDPEYTSDEALRLLVNEHEYRYDALRRTLGIEVRQPIRSYVYPNADVKARLTGARYTNVAPVWLSIPQTHILLPRFYEVFPHELVHVFSREFGLPLVRASLAVGLVEGLAVALEPPTGAPGPHEQVSAALLSGTRPGASSDAAHQLAKVVASKLSPAGFWTGRGAVSYTTMGSFVRFLLEKYGPEPFMRAYPTGSFVAHYGRPREELAGEWTVHLLSLPAVSSASAAHAAARFAVPSLFEKDCPHYIPPHRRRLIDAQRALTSGDTTLAFRWAEEALKIQPGYVPALSLWSTLALRRGEAEDVIVRLGPRRHDQMTAGLYTRRGDAYALVGRPDSARGEYNRAIAMLPPFAHESASMLLLRHALADRASVLEGLIRSEIPTRRNRSERGLHALNGVDSLQGAAVRVATAIAVARDARYELAVDLMRTTSPTSLRLDAPYFGAELVRRRLAWLSEISYRAGDALSAGQFADSAAAAYRDAGALNEAGVMEDVHRKMLWVTGQDAAANVAERATGTAERSAR